MNTIGPILNGSGATGPSSSWEIVGPWGHQLVSYYVSYYVSLATVPFISGSPVPVFDSLGDTRQFFGDALSTVTVPWSSACLKRGERFWSPQFRWLQQHGAWDSVRWLQHGAWDIRCIISNIRTSCSRCSRRRLASSSIVNRNRLSSHFRRRTSASFWYVTSLSTTRSTSLSRRAGFRRGRNWFRGRFRCEGEPNGQKHDCEP